MDGSNKQIGVEYSKMYFGSIPFKLAVIALLYMESCTWLIVYNIFAIMVYITLGITARKAKNLGPILFACASEIHLYTVLMSVLLGTDSGFMTILIGATIIAYFTTYAGDKRNLKKALMMCMAIVATFYLGAVLRFLGCFQLYHISEKTSMLFYILNTSMTFVLSIGFMLMFTTRVESEQTLLEKENSELENTANYDPLTRLLNRKSFDKYISEAFERVHSQGADFSVLMCDIDDFKKVNDTYGHDGGDAVLIEISNRLKNILRADDVIFRWGGEEIIILVSGGAKTAKAVAERCRVRVADQGIPWKDYTINVHITIGVCAYFQGATKDTMIEKADANLYIGKKNGKNQVVI